MIVAARIADLSDLPALVHLYDDALREQVALKPVWALADGLPEPVAAAFEEMMDDPASLVVAGTIDDVVLGFAWARPEPLLPQAGDEHVGVVRLIYTDPAARGVGVGQAMIDLILDRYRTQGLRRFDARVGPGHRHAKNFFESNGFSARLITMYHEDDE